MWAIIWITSFSWPPSSHSELFPLHCSDNPVHPRGFIPRQSPPFQPKCWAGLGFQEPLSAYSSLPRQQIPAASLTLSFPFPWDCRREETAGSRGYSRLRELGSPPRPSQAPTYVRLRAPRGLRRPPPPPPGRTPPLHRGDTALLRPGSPGSVPPRRGGRPGRGGKALAGPRRAEVTHLPPPSAHGRRLRPVAAAAPAPRTGGGSGARLPAAAAPASPRAAARQPPGSRRGGGAWRQRPPLCAGVRRAEPAGAASGARPCRGRQRGARRGGGAARSRAGLSPRGCRGAGGRGVSRRGRVSVETLRYSVTSSPRRGKEAAAPTGLCPRRGAERGAAAVESTRCGGENAARRIGEQVPAGAAGAESIPVAQGTGSSALHLSANRAQAKPRTSAGLPRLTIRGSHLTQLGTIEPAGLLGNLNILLFRTRFTRVHVVACKYKPLKCKL